RRSPLPTTLGAAPGCRNSPHRGWSASAPDRAGRAMPRPWRWRSAHPPHRESTGSGAAPAPDASAPWDTPPVPDQAVRPRTGVIQGRQKDAARSVLPFLLSRCCRTPGRRASPSQAAAWFAENSVAMLPRLPFSAKAMPMHDIIAGRFELQDRADEALAALRQAGFAADALAAFYLNPHGQHDLYPIGGDDESSAGARHAGGGAARGG